MPHCLDVNPKGVIHIGANTGEESDLYDAKPSIKKVVWLECNHEVIPYLRQNVEARPGHYVIEAVVCDQDFKELDFHLVSNGASSSILPLGEHANLYPNIKEVKVQKMVGWTVDTLLRTHGHKFEDFDFVELDIQGAELLAMQGMSECFKYLKYVYCEVNFAELYKGCALLPDVDAFLAKLNFKRVALADTGIKWGDGFWERKVQP